MSEITQALGLKIDFIPRLCHEKRAETSVSPLASPDHNARNLHYG